MYGLGEMVVCKMPLECSKSDTPGLGLWHSIFDDVVLLRKRCAISKFHFILSKMGFIMVPIS